MGPFGKISLVITGALAIVSLAVIGFGKKTVIKLETGTSLHGVYFVPDPDAPEFRARLILHRGEADMSGREGLAHYIEHVVFQNSFPKHDEDWMRDSNAFTASDHIIFMMDSPQQAQVMSYLSSVFKPITLQDKEMLKEAEIVRKEYASTISGDPFFSLFESLSDTLYAPNPLARSVIGHPDDILHITRHDVLENFERHFDPQNADLILTGNLSAREAVDLVEQYFAGIERASEPRKISNLPIPMKGNHLAFVKVPGLPDEIAQSFYLFPCAAPSAHQTALEVLTLDVISSVKEGGFFRKLESEELFSNINAHIVHSFDPEICEFGLEASILKSEDFLATKLREWLKLSDANKENLRAILKNKIQLRLLERENILPHSLFEEVTTSLRWNGIVIENADYAEAFQSIRIEEVLQFLEMIVTSREVSENWSSGYY